MLIFAIVGYWLAAPVRARTATVPLDDGVVAPATTG